MVRIKGKADVEWSTLIPFDVTINSTKEKRRAFSSPFYTIYPYCFNPDAPVDIVNIPRTDVKYWQGHDTIDKVYVNRGQLLYWGEIPVACVIQSCIYFAHTSTSVMTRILEKSIEVVTSFLANPEKFLIQQEENLVDRSLNNYYVKVKMILAEELKTLELGKQEAIRSLQQMNNKINEKQLFLQSLESTKSNIFKQLKEDIMLTGKVQWVKVISENGTWLDIRTKKLVAYGHHEPIVIYPMTLSVNLSNLKYVFKDAEDLRYGYASKSQYGYYRESEKEQMKICKERNQPHPHIGWFDGEESKKRFTCCLGNIQDDIARFQSANNIYGLCFLLLNFLQAYATGHYQFNWDNAQEQHNQGD
jgi:hypothetical protein